MFIGLNPSTADETANDPTIRKCIGFTKRWGYMALCMTNLFAFRATLPKEMKMSANPVGLENDQHLLRCASEAALVVAAWGVNGNHAHRDLIVSQKLQSVGVDFVALRITKRGFPEHPLYVPYETPLVHFWPEHSGIDERKM